LRCPNCGAADDRVIDSRDLDDSTTVRRRRECSACQARFTTYERVEAARLIVLKSDGTKEEFDRSKLAAGLAKALTRRPVGSGAAEEAADAIEAALRARGVNEVRSSDIGEMAMDRLRALDHIAYIRFVSVYQSFDDLEQLKQEVDALYAERYARAPGQTTLRLVADDGDLTPIGPRPGRSGTGHRGAPRRR
jgi:transcriptional repressor NrdR